MDSLINVHPVHTTNQILMLHMFYCLFYILCSNYTPTQKRIVAPFPPPLSFKFGRTLCSKSAFSA